MKISRCVTKDRRSYSSMAMCYSIVVLALATVPFAFAFQQHRPHVQNLRHLSTPEPRSSAGAAAVPSVTSISKSPEKFRGAFSTTSIHNFMRLYGSFESRISDQWGRSRSQENSNGGANSFASSSYASRRNPEDFQTPPDFYGGRGRGGGGGRRYEPVLREGERRGRLRSEGPRGDRYGRMDGMDHADRQGRYSDFDRFGNDHRRLDGPPGPNDFPDREFHERSRFSPGGRDFPREDSRYVSFENRGPRDGPGPRRGRMRGDDRYGSDPRMGRDEPPRRDSPYEDRVPPPRGEPFSGRERDWGSGRGGLGHGGRPGRGEEPPYGGPPPRGQGPPGMTQAPPGMATPAPFGQRGRGDPYGPPDRDDGRSSSHSKPSWVSDPAGDWKNDWTKGTRFAGMKQSYNPAGSPSEQSYGPPSGSYGQPPQANGYGDPRPADGNPPPFGGPSRDFQSGRSSPQASSRSGYERPSWVSDPAGDWKSDWTKDTRFAGMQSSYNPSSSSAGGPPGGNTGGQFGQQSPFGSSSSNSMNSGSSFPSSNGMGGNSGSQFGRPSSFGGSNNAPGSGGQSPFGGTNNAPGSGSPFGQQSSFGSTNNAPGSGGQFGQRSSFGSTNNAPGSGSPFGQPSTFGASSNAPGSGGQFGQQSPFGGTSSGRGSGSQFGQQSPFGGSNNAQGSGGQWGSSSQGQGFGSSSTSSNSNAPSWVTNPNGDWKGDWSKGTRFEGMGGKGPGPRF